LNRERITEIQGISLVILFILGSTTVLGTGAEAGRDSWLAIILAIFLSFPILLIYGAILNSYPGKDLYEILVLVFGKFIGKLISLLYIWFSFHLGALVLRNFGEFIVTVSLTETPKVVPMAVLTFLCIWGIKSGIEVLGRWGQLALIVLILFIATTIIVSIPIMNTDHIKPIFSKGLNPILKGSVGVVAFPFAETVVFLLVFSSIGSRNSSYKVYLWGLIVGGIVVFGTAFSEIMVLGEEAYTAAFFPSYKVVSRVNIGDFIQRVEILVAIIFLGGGFIKICICLLATCRGIAGILGYEDYRFLATPIGLLMINLSILIYDSLIEMAEWAFSTWIYYALPFQVIIPTIILVGVKIKTRKKFIGGVKGE